MLFDKTFYGNSVQQWLIALVMAFLVVVVLSFLKGLISRRLRKPAERADTFMVDLVVEITKRIKFMFLFVVAIYVGSLLLSLPGGLSSVISKVVILALLGQSAIWGAGAISLWVRRYQEKSIEKEDSAGSAALNALGFILRLILWTFIFLLALDNLGINITALIAGLGVGGVAVALALQNILGDLFASLSIIIDKPFVLGDSIVVDDFRGTVEHIGLKSTRIRSLSGEQLIFSNNDLLRSRIRNYKRMKERRVGFSLGVVYQTPPEKLAAIPGIIREIVESQKPVRFDRSHFKEYKDFALSFETVYWMEVPDYNVYMDIQQAINLEIFRRFKKEGIEFAYPTQTLYFEKGEG
ncbi:MAG: mechanosensitive ion channel family protein [Candidatus Neomarinimicrobiota bacterium]